MYLRVGAYGCRGRPIEDAQRHYDAVGQLLDGGSHGSHHDRLFAGGSPIRSSPHCGLLRSLAYRPGWRASGRVEIAMSTEHISIESPFPGELSVDGEDRVTVFSIGTVAPRLLLSSHTFQLT